MRKPNLKSKSIAPHPFNVFLYYIYSLFNDVRNRKKKKKTSVEKWKQISMENPICKVNNISNRKVLYFVLLCFGDHSNVTVRLEPNPKKKKEEKSLQTLTK